MNVDDAFLRSHQSYISMLAPEDMLSIIRPLDRSMGETHNAHAGRALIAGFDAGWRETVEGFGEFEREEFFADRFFTRKE
jgi:hypothetical protein